MQQGDDFNARHGDIECLVTLAERHFSAYMSDTGMGDHLMEDRLLAMVSVLAVRTKVLCNISFFGAD